MMQPLEPPPPPPFAPSFPPTAAPASRSPNSPPQTPDLSPQSTRQPSPKARYVGPSHATPILSPVITGDSSIDAAVAAAAAAAGRERDEAVFSYKPSAAQPDLSPRSASPCRSADGIAHGRHDGDVAAAFVAGIGISISIEADADADVVDVCATIEMDDGDDADDEFFSGSQARPSATEDEGDDFEFGTPFEADIIICESLIIEELSDVDPLDGDMEGVHMQPYEVEVPPSPRGGSSSPARSPLAPPFGHHHQPQPDLDRKMMRKLRSLDFSSDSDSDSDHFENNDAYLEFIRKQREMRMNKRRSHSMASAGSKRALSELSDDSDELEWQGSPGLGGGGVGGGGGGGGGGGAARRMRRKTDHWSIQFADQLPPPRIDEQEEPDEEGVIRITRCGDHSWDRANLMQELPYCRLEIMEVDSN
jgi:hypothetical protein